MTFSRAKLDLTGRTPEGALVRTRFPGHFRPSDEHFRELWSKAVFTFDANVLLNLYRYSEATAGSLLAVLTVLKERIWLPNQFVREFLDHRLDVIVHEINECVQTRNEIDALRKRVESTRGHPFVDDGHVTALESLYDDVQKAETTLEELLRDDTYLTRLEELLEDARIGEAPGAETLANWTEEGRERYTRDVPPGYADKKKPEPTRYGDFFAWKEVLEHFKTNKVDLILVTGDEKDDWWTRKRGRIMSPRPELVEEFHRGTGGRAFYMYPIDRFLTFAKDELKELKIEEATIEEVRRVQVARAGPAKPDLPKVAHPAQLPSPDKPKKVTASSDEETD